MTVKEFKRELPDVPVRIGKRVLMAKASGRLCDDCTLTLFHVRHGKGYLRGPAWSDAHYSWDAVARAVTTGKPLNW